ncbi:MAG: zinc ribbon domain-containing protein [Candidatus Heimdallarchaeaceae archaeon]
MDTVAKILYQSISAVYEGTISSSLQYPIVYFFENNKRNTFYGFKLQSIHPTRLIARRYEGSKSTTVVDLLWLVDGIKFSKIGYAHISPKSSSISITGDPTEFIKTLEKDPLIQASIPDLIYPKKFLQYILVSSIEQASPKLLANTLIDLRKIPTRIYAVSRVNFNNKYLEDSSYFDATVNCLIASIDVIHQTIDELLKTDRIPIEEEKAYCIRCGMEIPIKSYYCPFCGAKQ